MPVNATLVTGFLGAGKTTLVNSLLADHARDGERVALIVNEFGSVGVDCSLVRGGPAALHEINRGSIFCTCVEQDFMKALGAVAAAEPPHDRLLIEATGVTETRNIARWFGNVPGALGIAIAMNLCVVDSLSYHKVHATMRSAREQVAAADVVILNKVNEADACHVARQEDLVRELNPDVPVIRWDGGAIDRKTLGDAMEGRVRPVVADDMLRERPDAVMSVTCGLDRTVDTAALKGLLEHLGPTLHRAKGVVISPDGPVLAEWTLNGASVRPARKALEPGVGYMVFIGERLDGDALMRGLEDCYTDGAP